jgi:CrcB protein
MHVLALRNISAVFFGGSLGALLRWQINSVMNNDFFALMLINLLGSFLIGFISSFLTQPQLKTFFQVGFLGSFTSMSALIILVTPNLTSLESLIAIFVTLIIAPMLSAFGSKLTATEIR